jgi:hypothetical protein
MATIVEMDVMSLRNLGQYKSLFLQKTLTTEIGIGAESDVVQVITAQSLKTYTSTNASLYESLSTEEAILNDTANWSLISSGVSDVYPLSRGASYLKIINSSSTVPAVLEVTGV